jgi:hypothetical protein
MAFRFTKQRRHPGRRLISQLNTHSLPLPLPTLDVQPLRQPAHSMPVYPGARGVHRRLNPYLD